MNMNQFGLLYQNNKMIFNAIINVVLFILLLFESIQTFMIDSLVYFYLTYDTMHLITALNRVPSSRIVSEEVIIQLQKWMVFSFLTILQSLINIFLILPGKFIVTYLCNASKILLIILLINGYTKSLTSFNGGVDFIYEEFTGKIDDSYNYIKQFLQYEPNNDIPASDDINHPDYTANSITINNIYKYLSNLVIPNNHVS